MDGTKNVLNFVWPRQLTGFPPGASDNSPALTNSHRTREASSVACQESAPGHRKYLEATRVRRLFSRGEIRAGSSGFNFQLNEQLKERRLRIL